MDEEIDLQGQIDIAALLGDLKIIRANPCSSCGTALCGHEALMSLTMGFKDAPRCWPCLAAALAHGREALRDHLFAHIANRTCYYEGWLWANREEGFEPGILPGCLWPAPSTDSATQAQRLPEASFDGASEFDANPGRNAEWDAGEMGCGDLVLELRTRLQSLKPGQVLKVLANDPGAAKDLPAWCRMTGHTLVGSKHPVYLIKRKAA
jgi:tRNA 2-thiouridine synthesizing protein A